MLDQQPTRLGAVAPGVPTQRRTAECFPKYLDGLCHVRALGRLIDLLITDPAQSVTGDFVAQLLERTDRLGMTPHSGRDREYRQRQLGALEHAKHTPQTGA